MGIIVDIDFVPFLADPATSYLDSAQKALECLFTYRLCVKVLMQITHRSFGDARYCCSAAGKKGCELADSFALTRQCESPAESMNHDPSESIQYIIWHPVVAWRFTVLAFLNISRLQSQ
jgi:hypothetical protein